jgi:predicted HTH domain antitoxin
VDKHIKDNFIRVLGSAVASIKNQNFIHLKNLSNETIHDATIHQDEYSTTLAILIYSLSKIYEREERYSEMKGWKIMTADSIAVLEKAKQKLLEGDEDSFNSLIKDFIGNRLNKLDQELKLHIQDVIEKARINKASRLYEHGISLGRTAELLGISKFDLMEYVGKTYIADAKESITMKASDRLDFARSLFK